MAPVTVKNKVNPLTYNVPIVSKDGSPTYEFQVKWLQQAHANAAVVDLTTAKNVSAVLDLIGAGKGSILYRGAIQWNTLSGAAGHDGWVLTWNDTTGLSEWRAVASGGAASSFYLDGTDGYVALVDSNGQLVLDSLGRGVYSKDPVLPPVMIPPLKGVTDGSSAPAGIVGQIITSGRVTGVALTSGTQTNITSIVITPGDWDVFGNFYISVTGSATAAEGAISTTSATVPPLGNLGIARLDATYSANGDFGLPCGTVPMNVTVNTTVYLVGFCVFTGGPVNGNGTLSARRIR
jgi:hypothetical protein